VLGSNLWTERLPVISIMEKQRLGGPSWDHMSKAIRKKEKKRLILASNVSKLSRTVLIRRSPINAP
jgi:hypothetical protein